MEAEVGPIELLLCVAGVIQVGPLTALERQDFVEAILLEVHRAQYLQKHPSVQPKHSLLQDQLLADSEETLLRHGGALRLAKLQKSARARNLADSQGRIKSDFIEPVGPSFWERG